MLTFTLVQPAVKGVWAQGNTNTGFDGKLSPVGPRSGHKTVTAAQCNFFLRPLSPTFHWLPSSLFPLHIARVGPGFRYYIHPSQVSGIMRNYSNGLCLWRADTPISSVFSCLESGLRIMTLRIGFQNNGLFQCQTPVSNIDVISSYFQRRFCLHTHQLYPNIK